MNKAFEAFIIYKLTSKMYEKGAQTTSSKLKRSRRARVKRAKREKVAILLHVRNSQLNQLVLSEPGYSLSKKKNYSASSANYK